jgi:hypothetical protein
MTLADRIRHPAWTVALVLLALGAVALLGGGTAAWLAQGGLATLVTGLVAAVYYLGLIRLTRWLRVTTDPDEAYALSSHPLARPMLRGANYLGAAIVTLAVFG